MNLTNKVAVITGVSSGIGKSLAIQLLKKGCKVIGLGRNNADIENENFSFIKTDIRIQTEVAASMRQAIAWGDGEIHILINNAGLGYFGLLEELPLEQWHEMFDTNVNGLFYATREVLPLMKKQQAGHIINIASTAALEGMPQVSGYCATKWAVKGISESLWREVREDKIKVTCVYPGSTQTEFFRNSPNIKAHSYMLQPEDVAAMIIYALETPDNFHQVNLEIRPLQPKGPK
jgi:NADP-dependent 3-hydroxy acid dehydrogenase YdfG